MRTVAVRHRPSAAEIIQSLPEKTRAEVIDNELIFLPAARLIHQKLIQRLSDDLRAFADAHQRGEFIGFQCDVYLNENNIVQPDAMFISNKNLPNLRDNGMFGTPDMIIEVLSPSNRRHDLMKKKELYERFGVAEYWIIDPDTRMATGYKLSNGKYELLRELYSAMSPQVFGKEFLF